MNIFEKCPILENDRFLLRMIEKEDVLFDIISLVTPQMYEMLGCSEIITKAPIYAVERIEAIQRVGFVKSEHLLKGGHDGYAYNGYWTVKQ